MIDEPTVAPAEAPRLRLFIAVDPSEHARVRLEKISDGLRAACREVGMKASFQRPEHLHLTLKFLGDVEASKVPEIVSALDVLCATDRFEIAFEGLGAFPNEKKPNVLWVDVTKGRKELKSLAEQVDRSLLVLGYPPEQREYQPHLTLARVRRASKDARRVIHPVSPEGAVSSPVTEVVLYRSDLGREGSKYTALARFPLGSG
jgi:2'-5' RNA ligase